MIGYHSCDHKPSLDFVHVWAESEFTVFCMPPTYAEDSEVFRVRKSNHSKKIVKQLKREYKEDLEKSGCVKQESKSGASAVRCSDAESCNAAVGCFTINNLPDFTGLTILTRSIKKILIFWENFKATFSLRI